MPKYLNYPMLKELKPRNTEPVPIFHENEQAVIEDETQTVTITPMSILGPRLRELFQDGEDTQRHQFTDTIMRYSWTKEKPEKLTLPPIRENEAYPGQHVFQREVKSIMHLVAKTQQAQLLEQRKAFVRNHKTGLGFQSSGLMRKIAEGRVQVEHTTPASQMKRLQKYATADILQKVEDAYAEYLSDKFSHLNLHSQR
jgi:hypothetical protein